MGVTCHAARAAQRWKILLTLMCALLVVVVCTVQVAHTHADGAANHADCSLCVAAHTGVQVPAAPAIAPVATVTVAAVETAIRIVPVSAVSTFALFNRPPPAYLLPA